jgi:hypothetical protein
MMGEEGAEEEEAAVAAAEGRRRRPAKKRFVSVRVKEPRLRGGTGPREKPAAGGEQ